MTLRTDKLEICEGKYVDITRESWENVIGLISCISVFASTPGLSLLIQASCDAHPAPQASEEKLTISVKCCNTHLTIRVKPTTKLQSLYTAVSRRCHVPEINLSLCFEGRTLAKRAIVAHSGLKDGSVVDGRLGGLDI